MYLGQDILSIFLVCFFVFFSPALKFKTVSWFRKLCITQRKHCRCFQRKLEYYRIITSKWVTAHIMSVSISFEQFWRHIHHYTGRAIRQIFFMLWCNTDDVNRSSFCREKWLQQRVRVSWNENSVKKTSIFKYSLSLT